MLIYVQQKYTNTYTCAQVSTFIIINTELTKFSIKIIVLLIFYNNRKNYINYNNMIAECIV